MFFFVVLFCRRFRNKFKPDETDAAANTTSFPDSLSLTSYKTDARWQQSVRHFYSLLRPRHTRNTIRVFTFFFLIYHIHVFFYNFLNTLPFIAYAALARAIVLGNRLASRYRFRLSVVFFSPTVFYSFSFEFYRREKKKK